MPSVRVFYARWTREDLLLRLRQGVEALRREVPLEEAWLFGSWAQGLALPGSDVDLLLVYRGAPRPDLHRLVRRAFPGLPVEPHAYTEKEAEALAQVLARMREGAIPLLEPGP
jgi:predicted nucleotidyltransferase